MNESAVTMFGREVQVLGAAQPKARDEKIVMWKVQAAMEPLL